MVHKTLIISPSKNTDFQEFVKNHPNFDLSDAINWIKDNVSVRDIVNQRELEKLLSDLEVSGQLHKYIHDDSGM